MNQQFSLQCCMESEKWQDERPETENPKNILWYQV